MPDNEVDVSLKTQLEEAEGKGHKRGLNEGHDKGMADLLALLAAADNVSIPDYPDADHLPPEFSWRLRARINAALIEATKDNEIELVSFFLNAGADINAYNKEHRTALQCAVGEGNIKMVKALLKAGASLNPRDKDYEFVYSYDDPNYYVSPLMSALEQGNMPMIKVLLAAGALLVGEKAGDEGWLICYEAEGDQVELTRAFIKAGAYLGPYYFDHFGTPLMQAVSWGKTESAALLLEAGSDVNAHDLRGDTVLMAAAKGGSEGALDTIRLLLKAGAEVNYINEDGYTALISAARAGRSEAVRLLLSAGADVFTRAPSVPARWGKPEVNPGNAFDLATNGAVKEIVKSEMHRRIAAALSVLPSMPLDVRQKIVQLLLCKSDTNAMV